MSHWPANQIIMRTTGKAGWQQLPAREVPSEPILAVNLLDERYGKQSRVRTLVFIN